LEGWEINIQTNLFAINSHRESGITTLQKGKNYAYKQLEDYQLKIQPMPLERDDDALATAQIALPPAHTRRQ
jgi:hypothetical protein